MLTPSLFSKWAMYSYILENNWAEANRWDDNSNENNSFLIKKVTKGDKFFAYFTVIRIQLAANARR